MFWNFFMHALIGLLGPAFFTFTPAGIGLTVLVVCITQAVDLLRIKREMLQKIEALPEEQQAAARQEMDANLPATLAKIFVQNAVTFSLVVLIMAEISRSWGLLGTFQ